MRGSGRVLGALIAIALLIGVAGIANAFTSSGSPASDLPVAGSGPKAAAATTCPAPGSPTADVASRLVSQYVPAPAGFVQAPDTQAPNGPISLEADAQAAPNPPLFADRLRTDGFMGGYRRVWDDAGAGLELHVVLFQFTCTDGANDDLDAETMPDTSLASPRSFDVASIPSSTGFTGGPDKDGNYEAYVFATKGSVEMGVFLFGAQPPDTQLLSTLAQQQYQLLVPES